jgi:hypothetical protein
LNEKITVQDAVGQTLCHDITVIFADGRKGVRFRRGHVIKQEDIPEMLDIGKYHVFVWEPEADEVHEDDCAIAIARAAAGENIVFEGPSEGKVQLNAGIGGCLRKRRALRKINTVDDFTLLHPDL